MQKERGKLLNFKDKTVKQKEQVASCTVEMKKWGSKAMGVSAKAKARVSEKKSKSRKKR